jgi:Copper transport outer membrane protein, MctB
VIDFRYHLVSIIAIFLALAVGLLVGSTALSGKAVEALTAVQRAALKNNGTLTHQNKQLANQITADQAFASASSKRLLTGLLTGEKVIIITAPNSDSAVTSGVRTALTQAGATVTGEVDLSQQFLNSGGQNEGTLSTLAQQLAAQYGVPLTGESSSQVPGQAQAAQVLAAGLLTRSSSTSTTLAAASRQGILSGLSKGGYLSVPAGGPVPAIATLAVLVTPGTPAPQTGSLVLEATALALKDAGDGTVMAGSVGAIGSGSVISDEASKGQVSTVDNADTEIGQVMTAQALYLAMHGKIGQYGIGPGVAPSPAPSPTPSATLTPGTGPRR